MKTQSPKRRNLGRLKSFFSRKQGSPSRGGEGCRPDDRRGAGGNEVPEATNKNTAERLGAVFLGDILIEIFGIIIYRYAGGLGAISFAKPKRGIPRNREKLL